MWLSAAVWLSGTAQLPPAPLFVGFEFNWLDRDQVTVNIVNEQALTLTLDAATALQPEVLLPLDDLTPDVALQLPLVAEAHHRTADAAAAGSAVVRRATDGAQSTDRV